MMKQMRSIIKRYIWMTGLLLLAVLTGCSKYRDELQNSTEVQATEEAEREELQMEHKTEQTDTISDGTESVTEKQEETEVESMEDAFYISPVGEDLFERMKGKSYKDDCMLPLEDLRYLHVLHKNKEGETLEGELVCNVHIAEAVLDIFKKLYEAKYPIEKVRLVDEYDADDERSMEDNNSSSFNFRFISHSTTVSKHGLGLAVDINTLYNPYVKMVDGKLSIEPVTAEAYTDRTKEFDYKINEGDLCYRLFVEHGFEWGGNWTNAKDYQHFEIPDEQVRQWYPKN